MQKILVIGANGFIGRSLSRKLHAMNNRVIAFDRFTGGTAHFEELGIDTIRGDFRSTDDLTSALNGIDIVFHLVSATTPAATDHNDTIDLKENVEPTITLLELAVEAGVQKVIFTSTGGAIYGTSSHKGTSEEVVPMPVSPYAIGKLTIENYLHYFQHKYGLGYVTYRIANLYGPGQVTRGGFGVVPAFIERIRAGRPITVMGDGSMTRDYIYIDDAIDMIVASYEGAKQRLYNIGTGTGASVLELVGEVEAKLGKKATIEYSEQPKTYTQDITLDISRYEREFGLVQFTSLSEGIRRTAESS